MPQKGELNQKCIVAAAKIKAKQHNTKIAK